MSTLHKYSVTLKDGHVLLVEAEGHNEKMLPGWTVFTRHGKGYQAVAAHAIKEGPTEVSDECESPALNAVLADMLLKEDDAPHGR
ncbi:MAG: hypothetical protein ACAI34_24390 [Verrucomicrobium sp.]|nr:hypothetical protein [Verrucomicrobium sp.]